VQDERQRLRSGHLIDEGVKVAGVAREAVAIGLGASRNLVRVAHADEIRRDQPAAGAPEHIGKTLFACPGAACRAR
jgi:hypothetical protein